MLLGLIRVVPMHMVHSPFCCFSFGRIELYLQVLELGFGRVYEGVSVRIAIINLNTVQIVDETEMIYCTHEEV
jgi:hypothetical protein